MENKRSKMWTTTERFINFVDFNFLNSKLKLIFENTCYQFAKSSPQAYVLEDLLPPISCRRVMLSVMSICLSLYPRGCYEWPVWTGLCGREWSPCGRGGETQFGGEGSYHMVGSPYIYREAGDWILTERLSCFFSVVRSGSRPRVAL